MAVERTYLDHNASSPLRAVARAAMLDCLDNPGNASSVHAEGRAARARIETARATLADLTGAPSRAVVFTSGATEAAALALPPFLRDGGEAFGWLLAGAGEHPAVLQGNRFGPDRTRILPLTAQGTLDLEVLAAALAAADGRCLVALQAANNETGVIQPVNAAADMVHARGGLLICDAVQATGRIPCDFAALGADALLLSAHKLGGPKGAGALVFRAASLHIEAPLLRGGGQEGGARAGTENIAAILGFAAAAREAFGAATNESARLAGLRQRMEQELTGAFPDLVVFGADVERLPNTSSFAVPGFSAETLLIALDLAGFALSSGSACSSGKVAASHVLAAMAVEPGLARGALRVSLGWTTELADVERFCETFEKTVRTMRSRRAKQDFGNLPAA